MNTVVPEKFSIEERNGELSISYKWFSFVHFFLLFFCVIWNGFLFFWYSSLTGIGEADSFSLLFFLFPLAHVAVGIGLTYYVICGFLNRTFITANRNTLEIQFKPLPWPGAKSLSVKNIRQLYVKEKVSRNKNGGTSTSYYLHLVTKDGKDTELLSGAASMLQADAVKFIEHKLEYFLGIDNVAIPGEYQDAGTANFAKESSTLAFPRPRALEFDPTKPTVSQLKAGYLLDYQYKTWEVADEYQYDWEGGQSHKMWRLVNENQEAFLFQALQSGNQPFYAGQRINPHLVSESIEEEIKTEGRPPTRINYKSVNYLREDGYEGKKFVLSDTNLPHQQVRLWFYQDLGKASVLVVEDFGKFNLRAYIAEAIPDYKIGNILPRA